MKSHSINNDYEFINGWYVDDPTVCEFLIDFFEASDRQLPGRVLTGVDKSVKDSIDLTIAVDYKDPVYQRYLDQLIPVVEEYIVRYPMCNRYSPWGIVEDIRIQKYHPGGGFHQWHTERVSARQLDTSRHLAFMTYLNTVEDAGETEWYHQKLKIKPDKGLTVIWPTDWTYTHRGIPSYTETKYIMTGWFNFMDQ